MERRIFGETHLETELLRLSTASLLEVGRLEGDVIVCVGDLGHTPIFAHHDSVLVGEKVCGPVRAESVLDQAFVG